MLELCTPIFANVKIMSFIKKNLESAVPLHGIDKLKLFQERLMF
jgi:4-hydroxythreonine-4-phosphate dehydrogenase